MSWTPEPAFLEQLRTVFAHSLSPDNELRGSATRTLEDARRVRLDLSNYLVYILIQPSADSDIHLRASAGLMLKNNILTQYDLLAREPLALDYIKHNIVFGLTQPTSIIRSIAGSAISAIVARGGLAAWPQILGILYTLASDNSPAVQESALNALSKVFEDCAYFLESDTAGHEALAALIPLFLSLARSPEPKVRAQALACLNHFISRNSQALFARIDDFLATLFSLAHDPDSDVRRNVCSAFSMLLDARPEKLAPHLAGIVDFCLHCMTASRDDDHVALEACEFLLSLADQYHQSRFHAQVIALLPRIIPVLLRYMVYSEDSILHFQSLDEDDADMKDNQTDIKPQHVRSRAAHGYSADSNRKGEVHGASTRGSGGGGDDDDYTTGNAHHGDDDDIDDEDDDDIDDDDDDDIDFSDWTLRKCAAAALDIFASTYKDIILQYTLPTLRTTISSPEWPVREAAILAYGAIAEGCTAGMSHFLPDVLPRFVHALSDPMAPVRQIACWTLGRYSEWICLRVADVGYDQDFIPVLHGLLRSCLDNNKKVQEAGCSGFANFTEHAGNLLIPYLIYVLRNLTLCFSKYQTKNLTILYDAVQTLVEKVGFAMQSKEYLDLLLPPLIDRWQRLADDDTDIFPLLECLSSVTAALGEFFAPFASPVFERAMKILSTNLTLLQQSMNDPTIEQPNKDFIVTTLDLLDGLVQGLGPASTQLIASADTSLMQMLVLCMRDPLDEVRQSAFALVGDMAIGPFDIVRPFIPLMMVELIPQVDGSDPACSAVCNNATWAAGEISLRAGDAMHPFIDSLLDKLVFLLCSSQSKRQHLTGDPAQQAYTPPIEQTILENAAITLGRLGISSAALIASRLETFAVPWCTCISLVADNTDEKDTAFRGMCHIIMLHPAGLRDCLPEFVEAVGRYTEPSPELAQMFANILGGFKNLVMGETSSADGASSNSWDDKIMNKVPAEPREFLRGRYGL
ncbi:armadillo-type protein [Limtongia smithiae]|uniref:armadillo-type protein n=1 Tax=Limtongia smithiae TaxID=1125753 RepID=UPI0034CEF97D